MTDGAVETAVMDLVAGAGSMMGQLSPGIGGGGPGASSVPGFDNSAMGKLAKPGGVKPTIDSLPDKVSAKKCQQMYSDVSVIEIRSSILGHKKCQQMH